MNRDELVAKFKGICPGIEDSVLNTLTDEQLAGILAGAVVGRSSNFSDQAERAKVIAWATKNHAALKASGKSVESFVETFCEARKKDPTFTAAKLIGG